MAGVRWYPGKRARLKKQVDEALTSTARAVADDLVSSGTLPYAGDDRGAAPGTLQESVRAEAAKGGTATVVTDTPYAKRLYYHPDYAFSKAVNAGARGYWYGPYMARGGKKRFARDVFAREMKARRR